MNYDDWTMEIPYELEERSLAEILFEPDPGKKLAVIGEYYEDVDDVARALFNFEFAPLSRLECLRILYEDGKAKDSIFVNHQILRYDLYLYKDYARVHEFAKNLVRLDVLNEAHDAAICAFVFASVADHEGLDVLLGRFPDDAYVKTAKVLLDMKEGKVDESALYRETGKLNPYLAPLLLGSLPMPRESDNDAILFSIGIKPGKGNFHEAIRIAKMAKDSMGELPPSDPRYLAELFLYAHPDKEFMSAVTLVSKAFLDDPEAKSFTIAKDAVTKDEEETLRYALEKGMLDEIGDSYVPTHIGMKVYLAHMKAELTLLDPTGKASES